MRIRKSPVTTLIFAGVIALVAQSSVHAEETPDAATSTSSTQQPSYGLDNVEGKFVVHEWGTFTTFSGSDGVFLDFRPLAQAHNDLPAYVLDRGAYSPTSRFLKARIRGRVRMETPVTYFYTDRVRRVNVSVDFPKGLLTEFYPPVRSILPPLNAKLAFGEGEPIGKSSLDWGTIDLIPRSALVPGIEDAELQARIAERMMNSVVPHGANEKHYAQARATDSALVHMSGANTPLLGHERINYFEKFLFYRGVGSFELPVEVTFQKGIPVFANNGQRPIHSVILIESRNGKIKATKIDQISPGSQQPFEAAHPMTLDELAALVSKSLVAEGLYGKEAQSMVNTWKDSWFTEEGRRVLYMVPGEVTEELLPLHITPAPKERLRVLVGRMEIMSPDDEAKLAQHVKESISSRAAFYKKHPRKKNAPAYPVPQSIQSWGRMAEPALSRISKIASEIPVQREAEKLLATLQKAK
ncbi:MAG: hypothetical protein AAF497_00060 [Planctomycetota bacterium]